MPPSNAIRWGILGCGKIAHKFASDLLLTEYGQLYACASKDKQKAADFATKYDAVKYFDSYESLAACEEIDVIYIATPHSFHHDHSILCMRMGKNVLCEKPMAIQQAQLQAMIEVVKYHNVFLMEAMWTAFLPAIIEVKDKVSAGVIGSVRHLSADFGFQSIYDPESRLYNPLLAGGSLLDIGIYPLYISLLILGMPKTIQAKAHIAPTRVDDECTILLSYEDGATASLYCSVTCHTDTKCEIYGTKGNIKIPGRFHEQDHYFLQHQDGPSVQFNIGKKGYGYYHEAKHVNDCLLNGVKESPSMPFQTSLQLVQLMDEIRTQIGVIYPF